MNIEIALLIQIGYIIYNYWKKDKITIGVFVYIKKY